MAEGEFALVRHHLEAALQASDSEYGDHDLYAALADAAAQQWDQPALRRYAPAAEALAAQCSHVLYQAIAHRAWGVAHRLAGEHADAEARLTHALDVFSGLDTRWQIGRTLHELGELARARANTDAARDFLSQALAAFEAMRAAPDAGRTRAALAALT